MQEKVNIFWFRRDLRLHDNVGLHNALRGEHPVLPIFIFDPEILDKLPDDDARVSFIHTTLQTMKRVLRERANSDLAIYYGSPERVFQEIIQKYAVHTVFFNEDYEPYAKKRDTAISQLLATNEIVVKNFKDQVIFEKDEVVKDNGDPYVVYTPYMRKWKERFTAAFHLVEFDTETYFENFLTLSELPNVALAAMGFVPSRIIVPSYITTQTLIQNYEATRNFPGKEKGTSRLGPHLRFGTVSIRQMVKKATETKNETFWNELIWREFFMQILWHFPHTVSTSFKPKYDRIAWRNNEVEFEKWKNGQTGYALVDAGMRELNQTGYMHNRVRMLVASFLCKHLLIDWRWGEAYFAEKLLDYEMASNVGNWQWASGSGVDAAPYFRIFNPMTQVDKFDKDKKYISQWVPELQELTYPQKIVDHKFARERCLQVYKEAVG
ncbi:MAG: deoxyribodipyrimidine photo-lyase [Bacteroidota bacterium]